MAKIPSFQLDEFHSDLWSYFKIRRHWLMKTLVHITISLFILSAIVIGQESWTNRNGDVAALDLIRTFENDGVMSGEFRDQGGRRIVIKETSLIEEDAARLRVFKPPHEREFPLIETAIAKLRTGEKLTPEEIAACEAEKDAYYEVLSERNDTRINTQFNKQDQRDCYMVMIKMALIDFPNHGGWPFRSALCRAVAGELKSLSETSKDPFIHFCAIFPSFHKRDMDHAVASYKRLEKADPFLANFAKKWTIEHLANSKLKTEFMNAAGIE